MIENLFMKRIIIALTAVASLNMLTANAQYSPIVRDKNIFNHYDLSLTTGTTGIGFDVGTPIGNYVRLRTGFSIMPRFSFPMSFEIQVGDDPALSRSKFEKLSVMLSSFTGNEVSQNAYMTGKATLWNWNVMVDVFPFKQNKHWHVTAGFFLGPSKVGEATNTIECMPTLLAVDIYNSIYDKLHGKTGLELYDVKLIDLSVLGDNYQSIFMTPEALQKLQTLLDGAGRMGVRVGYYRNDVYYDSDVYGTTTQYDDDGNPTEVQTLIHAKGDLKYAKGEPYMMEPDENSMTHADLLANSFKPYVGLGYNGRLSKKNDRYHIAFDCGAMFWGGAPKIIAHDGTDLMNDVENVEYKLGDYIQFIRAFKVYPVFNLRFSYRLF